MTRLFKQQVAVMPMIAFCCLLHSCSNSDQAAEQAVPVANAPDTVPVYILRDTGAMKEVALTAELLPYEQSVLYARVPGYVREIKVDIGDVVRRGQVLAYLEAPELNTREAEYRASLQAAKAKYQTSLDLYDRMYAASQATTAGIVAPVDLARSRNQLMADSASYQAAKLLAQSYEQVAGLLVMRAPFDGVITARGADRGALVGSNQVVLTVQNNRRLRLRVAVPEIYVNATSATKAITFRLDAFPEKQFTATLSRKSGTLDPATRTELWEYLVDNAGTKLIAGSFAYVTLNLQRQGNTFIVPPSSIATNQERRFVIRVKNGQAEWVDVRQGMSTDKGVELFGDLHNGDTLLTRASDERKPGFTAYWSVAGR